MLKISVFIIFPSFPSKTNHSSTFLHPCLLKVSSDPSSKKQLKQNLPANHNFLHFQRICAVYFHQLSCKLRPITSIIFQKSVKVHLRRYTKGSFIKKADHRHPLLLLNATIDGCHQGLEIYSKTRYNYSASYATRISSTSSDFVTKEKRGLWCMNI